VRGQLGRGSARYHRDVRHHATDHAACRKLSHADHAINTLGEQINRLITDPKDDFDIRVPLSKFGQPPDWLGRSDRNVDAKTAFWHLARATKQVLRPDNVSQNLRRSLIKQFAFARHLERRVVR